MLALGALSGSWLLRRSVDTGATMTGVATFARRDDGRLDYAERGQLTLTNGQILDAERHYIFEEEDCGFLVWLPKVPPRLFHRVALRCNGSSLVGTAVHWCGDDRYTSRYEFVAAGSFVVQHAVCGPRKRYVIETLYARSLPL
jgi:hypothetical protein